MRIIDEALWAYECYRALKSVKWGVLSQELKNYLASLDPHLESEVSTLLASYLADRMLKGSVSPEFVAGFKAAAATRVTLCRRV